MCQGTWSLPRPRARGAGRGVLVWRSGVRGCFPVCRPSRPTGTGHWHVGKRADPRMRAAAERRGIDLPSRARQIEPEDLSRFDWIITMDDSNLANVRALDPSGSSHDRIVPLTSHCSHHEASEVPDPYYGGEQGFEHVLDLLEDACSGLLKRLR